MTVDRRRWIIRRGAVVLCVIGWLVAFVMTHIPINRLPAVGVSDSRLHFIGYVGLTGLLLTALRALGRYGGTTTSTVMMVMVVYAAFDEITQPLAGRFASWSDWQANVTGAAAMATAWEIIRRIGQMRSSTAGSNVKQGP